MKAGLARELDELGARPIGPDHDHGLRLRALDDPQCRRDEFGVALERAFGAQFHAALLQRAPDARQAVAAEGIILVEDRDIREVKILGQMLDPGLGLGAVAGADIDDAAKLGGAQEFGAGKWADERHVSRARNRNRRNRGWRADGADQRKDVVLLDQLRGLDDRAIGIITVIAADKVQLAAVHPALGVDLRKRREDALPHALPERGRRPLERCGLTEQDRI
jgi:hypothetical protein